MKSSDLIREMQAAGWVLQRVKGSHHIFKHPSLPDTIAVPHPKKDLPKGTLQAIRKQAGLTGDGQ
ncbi:MAG TPA: type II toxin-antitoxin system HicA family toxin [Candidatus Acidoferrum sp.]|nr:type II toxin-antitoxin system HicA family toxin [Candidatus Acidoferrum sp.]